MFPSHSTVPNSVLKRKFMTNKSSFYSNILHLPHSDHQAMLPHLVQHIFWHYLKYLHHYMRVAICNMLWVIGPSMLTGPAGYIKSTVENRYALIFCIFFSTLNRISKTTFCQMKLLPVWPLMSTQAINALMYSVLRLCYDNSSSPDLLLLYNILWDK